MACPLSAFATAKQWARHKRSQGQSSDPDSSFQSLCHRAVLLMTAKGKPHR